MLGVLLVGIGCGFFISKAFDSKEKSNNSEKKENNTIIDNNNNSVSEISIDDDIANIYKKYHTDGFENGIRLSSLMIEGKIYSSDIFEVSELQNNDITASYGLKIYENVKDELEKIAKYDEYKEKYYDEKDAEEIIKKGFKNIFSDNLTFNHETMEVVILYIILMEGMILLQNVEIQVM